VVINLFNFFSHYKSPFHTVIRIHLISLSYHILVILPSYCSSMEQMLMLMNWSVAPCWRRELLLDMSPPISCHIRTTSDQMGWRVCHGHEEDAQRQILHVRIPSHPVTSIGQSPDLVKSPTRVSGRRVRSRPILSWLLGIISYQSPSRRPVGRGPSRPGDINCSFKNIAALSQTWLMSRGHCNSCSRLKVGKLNNHVLLSWLANTFVFQLSWVQFN